MAKKWWSLFQRYLSSSLEYRAELIVWFFLSLLPTLLLILVWSSIFKGEQIQSYSLGNMIQYYMLVIFINELTASHFENRRVTQMREGKIDLFFTRPFSFQLDMLIGDIARKTMYFVLTAPFFFGTWWVLTRIWSIQSFIFTPETLFFFLLSLIITFSIEFLMALIIVMLGFWLEEANGLEHFKWIVISLFSGFFIPVVFMPQWLQAAVSKLPFQYMFAVPIAVLQGKETPNFVALWYPVSFILLLLIISQLLWRQALKKYASAGG